jgi:2-C-methyl-D-erythritol 2,4-cyclodiphosphate synthase
VRAGCGYDVHRLVEGKKLMLGGVEIPYHRGLEGHSDADVVLHALCDALLGAAAAHDIGIHFPNTDPQFKGISSLVLLERTRDIVVAKGYRIQNVDMTIIAEKPRLAEFIPAMRTTIGRSLRVGGDDVNIKATSNEGLGFIGREEGIAALAVASVVKVRDD